MLSSTHFGTCGRPPDARRRTRVERIIASGNRESLRVEVGTIVPDAVIGLDWLRRNPYWVARSFVWAFGRVPRQLRKLIPSRVERAQSRGEGIANSVSHGVRLLDALIGTPVLVLTAARHGTTRNLGGAAILLRRRCLCHAIPPCPAKLYAARHQRGSSADHRPITHSSPMWSRSSVTFEVLK